MNPLRILSLIGLVLFVVVTTLFRTFVLGQSTEEQIGEVQDD